MVRSTRINSKAELEKSLTPYSRNWSQRPYKRKLEQYPTSVSAVAHVVWLASMRGDLDSVTVADYGCGDGRFAVASLLVGTVRAICIEIDEDILQYATKFVYENYNHLASTLIFVLADATYLDLESVDVVVMNPPFGVLKGNRGMDLKFVESAMKVAQRVYSIHKQSEELVSILREIAQLFGFEVSWLEALNLEVPMIYREHRRKVYRVKTLLVSFMKRR
ncbi:MAG: methyltransferase [Desulfurococcaceae archaeon]